ncbi:hypothetical protein BDD12DRAFT_804625 [Trichophaea hybrida]|nr:hypothetical protein BDD12DRAFT_804625 [Trichophaea hybrida]
MPSATPSKSQQLRKRYGIPDIATLPPPPSPTYSCSSPRSFGSFSSTSTSKSCSKSSSPSKPQSKSSSRIIHWFRPKSLLRKFWPRSSSVPQTPPPPPPPPEEPTILVPARVQQLIDTLSCLDSRLDEVSKEALSHHTNLRACEHLGEMVQVLKDRHPQLKANVEVLRKGYEDSCNELYLLGKMGAFDEDWDEDTLVREMVKKRVHRLIKYLEEDLEDVEAEIREMEGIEGTMEEH